MLRRYRMYLLLAVAGLLAWLNAGSPSDVEVVQVTERAVGSATTSPSPSSQQVPLPQNRTTMVLPERLERPMLEPAIRDPFVGELPLPVTSQKAPPPPPVFLAAPIVPAAPPFTLRFAGRMRTPEGGDVVYLADGNTSLAIAVGQSLPNGYRVEAITARAVELLYPPLNITARLDLPEPPKYEIR